MSQRKCCHYQNHSELGDELTDLNMITDNESRENVNPSTASLNIIWLSETELGAVGMEDISVCSGELINIIPSSPQLVMNSDRSTSYPLVKVDSVDSSLEIESSLSNNRLKRDNNTSSELLDHNKTESDAEISTTSDITETNGHDLNGKVEDQQEVSVKNYEFSTTIFDTDDSSDSDDDTRTTDDSGALHQVININFGDDSNDDEHNFHTTDLAPNTSNSSITLFMPSEDNYNDNNHTNSDSIDYNLYNDNQDDVSSESSLPSEYDQNSTFIPTSIEEENDMNEILSLSENPVVIRYVHEGLMRGNTVSNILDDVLAQYKENTQNIEPDFTGAGDFVYEINPLFLLNNIDDSDSE